MLNKTLQDRRTMSLRSRETMSKVKNKVFALSIGPLIALLPLTRAVAEDWPQFRGPNGTGVSASTGLPEEFGPNKNVIWKTALPPGHSSPVLTRNRVFVTAYAKENAHTQDSKGTTGTAHTKENYKLLVICLDRQTGKLVWQREVPRSGVGRLQNVNGPASPSPVTDGSNVYVFFQEFGLVSFDGAGKERWRLPLGPFNSWSMTKLSCPSIKTAQAHTW